MKTEYLYALLDSFGACQRIFGGRTEKTTLTALLEEGWRPLRETPYHGTPLILICFEREPDGPSGFGFGR